MLFTISLYQKKNRTHTESPIHQLQFPVLQLKAGGARFIKPVTRGGIVEFNPRSIRSLSIYTPKTHVPYILRPLPYYREISFGNLEASPSLLRTCALPPLPQVISTLYSPAGISLSHYLYASVYSPRIAGLAL